MTIVQITWRDSNRYFEQLEADHDFSIVMIETVGYLVEKNESKVVVAQDNVEGELRGVIVIPVENIIEILEVTGLGEVKK